MKYGNRKSFTLKNLREQFYEPFKIIENCFLEKKNTIFTDFLHIRRKKKFLHKKNRAYLYLLSSGLILYRQTIQKHRYNTFKNPAVNACTHVYFLTVITASSNKQSQMKKKKKMEKERKSYHRQTIVTCLAFFQITNLISFRKSAQKIQKKSYNNASTRIHTHRLTMQQTHTEYFIIFLSRINDQKQVRKALSHGSLLH